MSRTDWDRMPDDARLWTFAAERPLDDAAREALLARMDDFMEGWNAHGHPVVGARTLRDDRFLLVAADERATGVSGCSGDALFRAVAEAGREVGVAMTDDGLGVWFRGADGEIRRATRGEFRRMAEAGEVGPETVVWDLTTNTVGDVRAGRWETRVAESWHARAFPAAV